MQSVITNARSGRKLSRNYRRNRANVPFILWLLTAAMVAFALYFLA